MKKKSTLLLIFLLALFSCSKSDITEKNKENYPSNEINYFMAGNVASNEKINIYSKIASRVTKINGEIGDTVKSGDNLIFLEKKDISAQLSSAEKNFENAKLDMERYENSFKNGFISQQEKESMEYKFKQAQAALEIAKVQYENGILISPINGIISSININAGELAFPNVPLMTIVNINNIYINSYIPEDLLFLIKPGMDVLVNISDKIFPGKISVIDPVIDQKTKNALVKVTISSLNEIVKPGMAALVGINKTQGESNEK